MGLREPVELDELVAEQLRCGLHQNTDRFNAHRLAQFALAVALIITVKLVKMGKEMGLHGRGLIGTLYVVLSQVIRSFTRPLPPVTRSREDRARPGARRTSSPGVTPKRQAMAQTSSARMVIIRPLKSWRCTWIMLRNRRSRSRSGPLTVWSLVRSMASCRRPSRPEWRAGR